MSLIISHADDRRSLSPVAFWTSGRSPNCGRTPPSFAFAAICDTNGIGVCVYKSSSPEITGGFPEFAFGGNWQKPPSVAHSHAYRRYGSSAFRPHESSSLHSRWGITWIRSIVPISGEKSPTQHHLPDRGDFPTYLKNLYPITTIGLRFHSREKSMQVSGPSGSRRKTRDVAA